MHTNTPIDVLRSVFGFSSFRGQQEEIIAAVMDDCDVLAVMPTGSGKSLCYQIPSLQRPGVGVVISPLIALMHNQVAILEQVGVRAAFLNSSLRLHEAQNVERRLSSGELDLLYVAPERLSMPHFFSMLKQCQIALFAVDEAHCVSQWGHDFRPEYLKLNILKEHFLGVPVMALTATADKVTQTDILHRLSIAKARVFISGFDRPNIHYRIVEKHNAKKQLLSLLREEFLDESGIVYCLSRKSVDETAQWLKEQGFLALPYHAGLSSDVRHKNQETFLRKDGVIMVATIAFGMGIDKPNVRFVAHLDLPKSIEAYYQETGRAGRDGLPAHAWLAYGLQDVIIHRHMVQEGNAKSEQKQIESQKLDAMLGFCESTNCRRQTLLRYFGEEHDGSCNNCDNCLFPASVWDGTKAAQKALSCIFRTRERFGVAHLVDILLGKKTEKVQRFGHERLSVFGVGSDMKAQEWRSMFRQLIAMGLVKVDMEAFGALKLSAKCIAVMKGQESFFARKAEQKIGRKEKVSKTSHQEIPKSALFDALKALRLKLSHEQQKPPYVIFHDRTLMEMANKKPKDLDELGVLYGVGEHKLKHYGPMFLSIVKQHAAAQD